MINDCEHADAAAREPREHGAAEPAGSNHEHMRLCQPRLARNADFGQGLLPRVIE